MRWLSVCILLGFWASASASERGDALAKEADGLFKSKQFRAAALKIAEAHELDAFPVYLYNLGRAWELAGEDEAAIQAYGKYLGLPATDTRPALVEQAQAAIRDLRTRREARQATKAAPAFLNRTVVAIALGSVSVASLSVALSFGLAASSAKHTFFEATTIDEKRTRQANTKDLAAVTDITLAVGTAAAVAAFVLVLAGTAEAGPSVSMGVVPLPGVGGIATVGVLF